MNIGTAAKASGVSAKMIRHYESLNLIPRAGRKASGYRDYGDEEVQRLKFVGRARDSGFSIEQIRILLRLWQDRDRASSDVKRITTQHVGRLREQARRLEEMADALARLADDCQGDSGSECPILDELASPTTPLPQHTPEHHPSFALAPTRRRAGSS